MEGLFENPALKNQNETEVLFVDDSASTLNMYKLIGKQLGVKTHLASSAKEALKTLIAQPNISIMFLDIQMPKCNGHKFANFLKNKFTLRILKICYLSHLRSKKEVLKGLRSGVKDFIFKPVVIEDIREKITKFVSDNHTLKARYYEGNVKLPITLEHSPFQIEDLNIRAINEQFITIHSKIAPNEKKVLTFTQKDLESELGLEAEFVFEGYIEETINLDSEGHISKVSLINISGKYLNRLRSYILKIEN